MMKQPSELSAQTREAVYILCVLSAHTQLLRRGSGDHEPYTHLLAHIAHFIQVPPEMMELKYHGILQTSCLASEQFEASVSYVNLLTDQNLDLPCLIFEMIYSVNASGQYNAFHRAFFKSFARVLGIQYSEFSRIESNLNVFLNERSTVQLRQARTEEPNALRKYAKIGMASVGVGAAAAVAGALAAPAIAASLLGVLVSSGTTNAALLLAASHVTASASSVVFGSIGCGLGGYKMSRRLKGLEEFEFESHNKGHLAACIFVSGWMEGDAADYQRVFGVVPRDMSVRERLHRFFLVHDASRVPSMDGLIAAFAGDETALFDSLQREVGFDPRNNEALLSVPQEVLVSQSYWRLFLDLSKEPQRPCSWHCRPDVVSKPPREQTSLTEVDLGSDERGVGLLQELDASEEESCEPWNWRDFSLSRTHELYVLRWETALQLQLGDTVGRLFRSMGSSIVKSFISLGAGLDSLTSAVSLPLTVLRYSDYIDDVWSIAEIRADQAGREMALALASRYAEDKHSVSLVGFSMGSRVIFSCLKHLRSAAPSDFGYMIEDVVLLGSPFSSDPLEWRSVREAVSGRLVNGYSANDLLLGFVFRLERFKLTASGIGPVQCAGVENVDLGALVHSHGDYRKKFKCILDFVNMDSYSSL